LAALTVEVHELILHSVVHREIQRRQGVCPVVFDEIEQRGDRPGRQTSATTAGEAVMHQVEWPAAQAIKMKKPLDNQVLSLFPPNIDKVAIRQLKCYL